MHKIYVLLLLMLSTVCFAKQNDKNLLIQQLDYTHHLILHDINRIKKPTVKQLQKIVKNSVMTTFNKELFVVDTNNNQAKNIQKDIINAYVYGLINIVGLENLPRMQFELMQHMIITDNTHIMRYYIANKNKVYYTISYDLSKNTDGKWNITNLILNNINLLLSWRKLPLLRKTL